MANPRRFHGRFDVLHKPLLSSDAECGGPAAALQARFVERSANAQLNGACGRTGRGGRPRAARSR
ncbi:hypothetical protein C2U71_21035 [Burkholderia ubonensis]|nr:hypothetical protein C2U71_21035 [Burkholderia ubonensis]